LELGEIRLRLHFVIYQRLKQRKRLGCPILRGLEVEPAVAIVVVVKPHARDVLFNVGRGSDARHDKTGGIPMRPPALPAPIGAGEMQALGEEATEEPTTVEAVRQLPGSGNEVADDVFPVSMAERQLAVDAAVASLDAGAEVGGTDGTAERF
jgi:hypothetical protein